MARITRCLACKQVSDRPGTYCSQCEAKRCKECGKISVHNSKAVTDHDTGRTIVLCPKCFNEYRRINSRVDASFKPDTIISRLEALENSVAQLDLIIKAFVKGTAHANGDIDIVAPLPSDLENPDEAIDRMLAQADKVLTEEDIQTRIQKDLETLHSKPEVSTKEDNPNS